MAIRVKETRRSKQRTVSESSTAGREYVAWDTTSANPDPDLIEAAVRAVAPTTVDGLLIDSYTQNAKDEHQGVYDCRFEYTKAKKRETPETNDEEISFQINAQTVKVLQSLQTVNRYAASGQTAPDFKGGIGYDGEKFEGVDKQVESFGFSITKYVPAAQVNNAYVANLRSCAFKWNNALWRGLAVGECLFIGAQGAKRNADDYAITFSFAVAQNATGLTVGDISNITKQGWDALWVLYEETEDAAAKFVTQRPKAAYVERIYTGASFPALLGLPA